MFTSYRTWIGRLAYMVESVLCMHEAPGSMPGSSSFFFFSQNCIGGVKKLFRSHHNLIGGLAHMVERVLRMHEAPGSMPGSSSFFFFFFFNCISGVKKSLTSHRNWIGVISSYGRARALPARGTGK